MDRFEAWLRESGWADYVIGWHLAAGSTEEFIRPVLHPLQYCDYSQAACAQRFQAGGQIDCVLSGGLWRAPLLCTALKRQPGARGYRFVHASLPPVYGALTAAAACTGAVQQEEFRTRFSGSLAGFRAACDGQT